jgi:hypothetical protein
MLLLEQLGADAGGEVADAAHLDAVVEHRDRNIGAGATKVTG